MTNIECLVDLFKNYFHCVPTEITQLKGDASARTIYRLKTKEISIIGVYGPNTDENQAFLHFTEIFRKKCLPVPEIYIVSKDSHYYLEQDLGDLTLFDQVTKYKSNDFYLHPNELLYHYYYTSIEWLIRFQTETLPHINLNFCYQTKEFNQESWLIDQKNFFQFFIHFFLPDCEKERLESELKNLFPKLDLPSRNFFLYRDFQSRNIMITEQGLYFIDYQSGRKGALPYDLVSLLYDARANLSDDFRANLKNIYLKLIKTKVSKNELNKVEISFPYYAIMRIIQALGSYGRNGIVLQKPEYLKAIPYALFNLLKILQFYSLDKKFPYLYHVVQILRQNLKFEEEDNHTNE